MATRNMSRSAPIDPDAADGDTDAERASASANTRARAKRQSAENDAEGRTRSGGSGASPKGSAGSGGGWAAYRSVKAASSRYNSKDEFKITEMYPTKYHGKFLEDGPFSVYTQHFYKGRPDKKAFICCEDCPLCAMGEEVTVYAVFNVLDLNGAEPVVKYWRCTPGPAGKIEEYEEDGPINQTDRYFVAFKKESKTGYNEFTVKEVLDTKLMEKAGVEPFTEDELTEFESQLFTEDDVMKRSTRTELRQVAAELMGEDED